ncbi:hypothetical protein CR513_09977, partial [Mucuna pruriens]
MGDALFKENIMIHILITPSIMVVEFVAYFETSNNGYDYKTFTSLRNKVNVYVYILNLLMFSCV